ncbi:hypothetical protein AB0G74_29355 [Streptomyces sp. NPDC020875]|uniref:proline-rich domain-containing protein n=1 Tax=Streptomyces sp. NPDC020875 TaxID=3154898 RepID=UPI0033F6DAF1
MSTPPPPHPQDPQPEPQDGYGQYGQGQGQGHGQYGDPYGQQQPAPPPAQPPYQDPYAAPYPPQGPPAQGYGAPGYGAPQGQPGQGYGAPQGPPGQGYGTPPSYGYPPQPDQTHPIPQAPSFGAPQGGPGAGPGGWGAPQHPASPPPPPQKGRRTAKTVLIATGVIAGLLVLSWLGNDFFSDDDKGSKKDSKSNTSAGSDGGSSSGSDGGSGGGSEPEVESDGFPKAEFRLTMPPTLVDGKYKFTNDMSELGRKAIEAEDPLIQNAKAVVAEYSAVGGPQNGALIVSGLYGQIKQPDLARQAMLRGSASEKNSRLAVPPKDFKPAGSDVTVSCQVIVATSANIKITTPACAWADGNTGATVAIVDPKAITLAPTAVDLAQAAETTAKIRKEMRKPIAP